MTHDRTVASLLAAALLVLAPGATRAEWQPGGSPLAPRTGAVIAPDSHGGVFASTGYPDRFMAQRR